MGRSWGKLVSLVLFSVSFAYVEGAVVAYLRMLSGFPRRVFPLVFLPEKFALIELGREAATLIIIFAVAYIAEKRWIGRFYAYFFVFGLWDIFYYIWLKVFIGWPFTPLDQDLLFLIPLPWIGPVLAPLAVALLFSAQGFFYLGRELSLRRPLLWGLSFLAGSLSIILSFILPAWREVSRTGIKGLEGFIPMGFHWSLFLFGFFLLLLSNLWVQRG